MNINYISIIGLLAGALTTISFFPQLRKIYMTRKTRDLSLVTYLILATGLFLWVVYGVLINEIAIILPNSIIFVMTLYIIWAKRKYG